VGYFEKPHGEFKMHYVVPHMQEVSPGKDFRMELTWPELVQAITKGEFKLDLQARVATKEFIYTDVRGEQPLDGYVKNSVVVDVRYLPCRVDAPTTLIFPSATKIISAVASSDAIQVTFKAGESTMQVVSKANGEGSRVVITTSEGSVYTYEVHHEILNGTDCGAINYSVWPLDDERIKKVFEAEILKAIRTAPTKRYKISYSSKNPKFSVQPTVGFDGKRTAFLVKSPLNVAVLVYAGTKENHMPVQTVPLKFNSDIWISDRVSDHWFIRHEDEWVTIDALP
jgi:hypothetical protein